jgi:gluconate 2-dehydrogenase gamma chain
MANQGTSRRDFLAASAAAFASVWLTASPRDVRASMQHAAHAAKAPRRTTFEALTPEQAADVEAIASRIIPTDDSPGAREAGVVYFIDNALAHWASATRSDFARGLDELNAEAARRWPGSARFAALPQDAQVELLTVWDRGGKPFFEAMRNATIAGMFSTPEHGGNADKVGWQLIDFEDRYIWQPPFGSYDVEANGGKR